MLAIVTGYLIGSIPFSYILPKLFCGVDVRKSGTGNVGGSNAIRSAGITVGIISGILDFAKGLIATFIVWRFSQTLLIFDLSLLSIVVGHCFSIFLSFHGGRGIAPTLGILLYLNPLLFSIFVAISVIGIALKESALGTFIGIVAAPIAARFLTKEYFNAILLISIFLIFRRIIFVFDDLKDGRNFFHYFLNRLLFDAPEKKKYDMILWR